MKHRVVFYPIGIFLAFFFAVNLQAQDAKALALIVQAVGKSEIVRDSKSIPVKVNDLVRKGDLIRTLGDGQVSVQLSSGAIFRMSPQTEVLLQDLVHDSSGLRVQMDVRKGSLASQIDKLGSKDSYKVTAPTAIASVRGTQFIVEISDVAKQASVLVGNGAVGVSDSDGHEQVVPSGEKCTADGHQIIKSMMEDFEKEKFRIFADLKKFQRENFDQLVEQIRKNQEMMQQMRQNQP